MLQATWLQLRLHRMWLTFLSDFCATLGVELYFSTLTPTPGFCKIFFSTMTPIPRKSLRLPRLRLPTLQHWFKLKKLAFSLSQFYDVANVAKTRLLKLTEHSKLSSFACLQTPSLKLTSITSKFQNKWGQKWAKNSEQPASTYNLQIFIKKSIFIMLNN